MSLCGHHILELKAMVGVIRRSMVGPRALGLKVEDLQHPQQICT